MLAWETIIMRIDSFNNPPLSFNGAHISQVSLSTGGVHTACHIIRSRWLAFIFKDALSKSCEISDAAFHSVLHFTVEKLSRLLLIRCNNTSQGVSAHLLSKALHHWCWALSHHANDSCNVVGSDSSHAHRF